MLLFHKAEKPGIHKLEKKIHNLLWQFSYLLVFDLEVRELRQGFCPEEQKYLSKNVEMGMEESFCVNSVRV